MHGLKFEWDDAKDIENRCKHGLGFENPRPHPRMSSGASSRTRTIRIAEERFVLLGMSAKRLLVVCHCEVALM